MRFLMLLKFILLNVSLGLLVACLGVHQTGSPAPVKNEVEEGDGWFVRGCLSNLFSH